MWGRSRRKGRLEKWGRFLKILGRMESEFRNNRLRIRETSGRSYDKFWP